jgi:predicted metalloprotease with PDZ domain
MRGVNLNVFDFDYDLTWAAFFMNAEEQVYGRFGGRDGPEPDKYLTLAGLKNALRAALATHRAGARHDLDAEDKPIRTVEQFPAAKRLKAGACIHCHQVYDFARQEKKANGEWNLQNVWAYPPPQNLGLTLAPSARNRVQAVAKGSPAEKAGLQRGDELQAVNGQLVASFADVQYLLHRSPAHGTLTLTWRRDGKSMKETLNLPDGWRKTDISWRTSMWALDPAPNVYGPDLSAEEKESLGLTKTALAFRQAPFVPPPARQAGIQKDDIIIGLDGKPLEMSMLQFNAYVRLNYHVGDQVKLNVIRNGQRMEVPMTLREKS